MNNPGNERMDRVEANLDRVTTMLIETAGRQSVTEHQIQQLIERQLAAESRQEKADLQLQQLIAAAEADGENIRALARIAEAHERRLDELDGGEA